MCDSLKQNKKCIGIEIYLDNPLESSPLFTLPIIDVPLGCHLFKPAGQSCCRFTAANPRQQITHRLLSDKHKSAVVKLSSLRRLRVNLSCLLYTLTRALKKQNIACASAHAHMDIRADGTTQQRNSQQYRS